MGYLLLFAGFLAFLYLALLRPQQQRVRKQQELINAIEVGDYVVTVGGMVARVAATAKDRLQLELADGVLVEFLRPAVNRKIDPSEVVFETSLDDGGGEAVDEGGDAVDDGGEESESEHDAAATDSDSDSGNGPTGGDGSSTGGGVSEQADDGSSDQAAAERAAEQESH